MSLNDIELVTFENVSFYIPCLFFILIKSLIHYCSVKKNKTKFVKYILLIKICLQVAYLLMRVDLRITLIMFYGCKPKNEEREKANTYEFVSHLRCHKLFTLVNR